MKKSLNKNYDLSSEDMDRMRRRHNVIWLIGLVFSITFTVAILTLAFEYIYNQSQHNSTTTCSNNK